MMANLFSSFDPTTNWNTSLNWVSSMILFLMLPPLYWMVPSRLVMAWLALVLAFHKEFSNLIKPPMYRGSTLVFCGLFVFIVMNNFLGLFPYIFTSSGHLSFSLYLSLPLWLSFMIFGWIKNSTHMFAHLVPLGAPSALMPFLVIIETTSNFIRPGSLAIRLSANMIAGHLLLTLLGSSGPKLNLLALTILVSFQVLLLLLESAVAIIQSYVFSILTTLYSSEVNN
uniref:ATP synthase subunit a n=1 Tax=Trigonopterus sp. AH-2016 TaxID=1903843 RepID=A0A343C454_9CUCU|nr:ATP synthase F0 subunit 6 [Trigonopterus sp. AH-2016]